jgi:hypothetical protein
MNLSSESLVNKHCQHIQCLSDFRAPSMYAAACRHQFEFCFTKFMLHGQYMLHHANVNCCNCSSNSIITEFPVDGGCTLQLVNDTHCNSSSNSVPLCGSSAQSSTQSNTTRATHCTTSTELLPSPTDGASAA